jgi:glutamate racemase
MASGTSTAAGLEAAGARFPGTNIYGTIDFGAREAVRVAPGPIGVIATNATCNSLAFTHAVHQIDPARRVIEQGCPLFVPIVESGRAHSADALAAAKEYLAPLIDSGVESIILGCTHFPFLDDALNEALVDLGLCSHRPIFVDPAASLVESIAESSSNATQPFETPGHVEFAATGDPQEFARSASLLLGIQVKSVAPLVLDHSPLFVTST